MMFGKVFASTYTGSMLGAGLPVFALWPYMLSSCDRTGCVEVNPPLVAFTLGCSAADIEGALRYLLAEDPESRTPGHEGRRIERVGQFAYRIVNYARYREIRDAEARREYQREWAKGRRRGGHVSTGVDSRQASSKSTKAEAEAEAEGERVRGEHERGTPPDPTLLEAEALWAREGLKGSALTYWYHRQARGGWAGAGIRSWQDDARYWSAKERDDPQAQGSAVSDWGKDRPPDEELPD